jgi:hypothetical protein
MATDTGADPNKLVAVTDPLAASTVGGDHFATPRTATGGKALRGVSFTPGTAQ